ncbi:YbfB/YjiJ family MFS transporter [Seleniivibrio woodruffii]|uniref:YbfB/YjiJ family MFS transporter n=1 Tax=Seleniivibrio woodruffii TaxID=1078050 RepID=UPI0026EFD5AB|nr:YbfB/YjiJ family MFS transporter [Seleniivibrio woodruffii]
MELIRIITAGIASMAMAMGIARFAYTPMIQIMTESGVLTVAQAGGIASLNYLGYLAGSIFFMVKPIRSKNVWFAAMYFINATTLGLFALTQDIYIWSVLRTVSGFASAGMFLLMSVIVSEALAAKGHLRLAGLIFTGIGIGILISGFTVLVFGNFMGWKGLWIVFFIGMLLTSPLCFFKQANPHANTQTASAQEEPMHPFIYFLSAAYFLMGTAYIVSGTFLVLIIGRAGFSGYWAWMITGLCAVPGIIYFTLNAGRTGFIKNLIPAYVFLGLSCALPALYSSAPALFLAAGIYGATFLGIVALTVGFAKKLAGSHTAYAIGLVTVAFSIGQVIGPAAAGWSAEKTGNFSYSLMAASILCAAAILILLAGCFIYRRRSICRM